MNNEPEVINWGTKAIELTYPEDGVGLVFTLKEVHFREDGDDGKPSFTIVLNTPEIERYVVCNISLQTCNKILNQLHYQINKLQFDASQFNHGDRINHFFVPILNQLDKHEIGVLISSLQQRLDDTINTENQNDKEN